MTTNNWQPIETAPRDGTEILVWRTRLQRACVAWWFGRWWDISGRDMWGDENQPTHWQPLPGPPKEGE